MPDYFEKGSTFRHYKGQLYKYLGIVRHSETLEELVLYECLYENDLGKIWVRPKEMFFGTLSNGTKRFEPVFQDKNFNQ